MKTGPLIATLLLCSSLAAVAAPTDGFTTTTLATKATDPDLVNPWGLSSSATSPFWVSDNGTGKATLYNSAGVKQGLVVTMPAGGADVTGQLFNGTASFNADAFLFASESGTINGWRGGLGTSAETLFTVAGAVYKGLAASADKSTLYAANFMQGQIDVFGSAGLTGSFADPAVPAGYAPFNIQNLGGKLYVTFALASGKDDVAGAGHGFVKVFDPLTHAFSSLISQGVLDSPWGLALAPIGFGALGGDLLVGNFGDGRINVFSTTGSFIGALADAGANPLVIDGLWGLLVGNGGNGGSASSLYVAAGPDDESGGLFARIDAVAAPVPEPQTWALLLCGLALLATRGANRRPRAARASAK